MMKLYEKHAAIRDKFEILAFHDARAKTFEELDEKLAPIIEERWGGKALPFPILLDATRKTVNAYGISAFPTNVLIDPEGRVVKGNAEKNFEKKLEEMKARLAAEKDPDKRKQLEKNVAKAEANVRAFEPRPEVQPKRPKRPKKPRKPKKK